MFLNFPFMHAALAGSSPEGVLLFNPGLDPEAPGAYLPPDLALGPIEARRLLDEVNSLDLRYARAEELAQAFAAQSQTLDMERSSHAITQALKHGHGNVGRQPAHTEGDPRRRAQCLLLLAWQQEERELEVAGLQGKVEDTQRNFLEDLGFSEDDLAEARELGVVQAPPAAPEVDELLDSWPGLLAAMVCLCPEAGLYVATPRVLEDAMELGLELSADAHAPEGCLTGRIAAAALLGRRATAFGLGEDAAVTLAAPEHFLKDLR